VSATARELGHTISLWTTLALMLLVGAVLGHGALFGARRYAPTRVQRWGPFAIFTLAATLIMVEPVRHVANDAQLWPWCGNNPTYDRINSTDGFPPSCSGSSTQYVCTNVCCVSTWVPTDVNGSAYHWLPPTADFFPAGGLPGAFGTVRPDGTVYTPAGSGGPYALYSASTAKPLAFFETGELNPLRRDRPMDGCIYGVNPDSGYCLLTNQSLSYEEQLATLPLADPTKPYNASINPHVCACDSCTPHEDWGHLSVVGVWCTLLCTYAGFGLLAVAIGWNAHLLSQVSKIREQWRELRGQR